VGDNFQDILSSLPEKPPRSRLEPYGGLIIELRRRKRTYREIVDVLAEKCNLRISISTLHDFVRAKTKEARKAAKLRRATAVHAGNENRGTPPLCASTLKSKEDRPTDDEIRRRIAAVKQRPRPIPTDSSGDFQYNPDEPLRLIGDAQKGSR
jgi:IS30 family transposase